MAPEEEKFDLDESARALYRQFAGIDDSDRAAEVDSSRSELIEYLNKEEKMLDYYRLLLSQATCLFSEILTNSRFAMLEKENDQKIIAFINHLKKIATHPKFDGRITCRLRGQQQPAEPSGTEIGSSETYDYELSVGNLLLDYNMARIVEQREKERGKAIYAKLMDAFRAMSVMKIFNFSIEIGKGAKSDYDRIETTIRHLINFYKSEGTADRNVVLDEYDQPNINLTLLAATNKVKAAALQNLVDKIKPKILGPEPAEELSFFTTVYDVILASKKYREQLAKMPIEINNVQWLTQNLRTDAKKTAEAVQASRLVLSKYGNNPRMASEVISSINSDGYSEIRTETMGKRLSLATDFLSLAKEKDNKVVQKEALNNIEAGLDHVPDEIFDRLTIRDGEISTVDDQGESREWSLNKQLFGLVSFFKQRSETKKKVQSIANRNVQFDSEDYSVIARNFQITELEAAHLIDLLRNCFNEQGHFRRNFFEKNIPEFVQYESRVFGFLWHYLKELPSREDRVSFLNALQLLVGELKQPQDALKILLSDIFSRSAVNYSDRNGLILSSILLRTMNREARSNIELTPEEVLLVRKGLNQEMVQVALDFFEKNHELLMRKFRNLTEALLKSSDRDESQGDEKQPRFLLYLQREIVIFFALIGGEAAQSIVLAIVREFGNPTSSFYNTQPEKADLKHALQLLQVSVRALRRFENPHAEGLFDEIIAKESDFIKLNDDPSHESYVKRVLGRIRQVV
ncbi:MAG: hypothetical protein KKG47_08310 [Proteobacteria bacterium]|nr:hypothetical protein [Pseudomonadota bacterium]MBU1739338.1 hypothetical protein [Pseudomonadota bacterium]